MSVNSDEQLAELREQRRIELQKQFEEQANIQAQSEIETHRKNLESQEINNTIKKLLTSEARGRIARISLATPNRAESIKKAIISMYENNEFNPPMSDESLKSVLAKQSKSRNTASIRRI